MRSAAKILVIDDTAVNRRLIRALLAKEKYVVIEAADGDEGIARAAEESPDVILLDVMMPNKDGYQVITELKQSEQTRDIPVIFLTAKTMPADKVKGLELGGADYVTTPFHNSEILARVRNQLQIRFLTRSLVEANRELRRKQARIREDLEAAAGIQRSLLPRSAPEMKGVEVSWRFKPCEAIGGDILNVQQLSEDELSCYIIDVSGHGASSALVTVSVSQMLSPQCGLFVRNSFSGPHGKARSPAKIMEKLEDEFPIERFDKYFTICYLILNVRSGKLRYSSAGHPPPVLLRKGGSVELLEKGGPLIGLGAGLPFEEGEARMAPGDKLFLYTDGIVEYRGREGEFFGGKRFDDELRRFSAFPVEEILGSLMESMMDFGDRAEPDDDISLLGLEFTGRREE